MGRKPRDLDPTSSVQAYYGSELRRLREKAGLSHARLAEILNYSPALVGHIETATRMPTPEMSKALDAAFDTDGQFIRLYPVVRRLAFPDYSQRFMELEAQADRIFIFMVGTMPGLVQTEDYARAFFRATRPGDEAELESMVAARMSRQTLLDRPDPPQLWMVLDEAVIRRAVGGPAVMRAQLAQVLDLSERTGTVVQILPFSRGAHATMSSSLYLLHFPQGPEVAYEEGASYGRLMEDLTDVGECQLTYDLLRADALPPDESVAFIASVMEDCFPCVPPST
ncbi:helix-turn-helix domain-containing protein [Wenjunlia tyrosinilytica]|uniref:Transcriptional regulator n=1 Tax=Wenjunlia tyrosinilytica TaxID=1544741 RepID=A0A918E035_9ACTN|nr:helix-turn-helix transcriptional regulator [Wenjunlia tyrosinilytica]GGO95892.1 transcriptional regulator [Wenjunlia tyrosinilytica]